MTNFNLESDLRWDNDLRQIDFNENFKHLGDSKYLFLDYGDLSSDYEESEFFKIDFEKTKKSDLNDLKVKLYAGYSTDAAIEHDIYDLISAHLYYNNTLEAVEELLNDYSIVYFSEYEVFKIKDYFNVYTILVNVGEFEEVTGNTLDLDTMQELFDKLINSVPIWGNISISFEYITFNNTPLTYNNAFELIDININAYKLNFNDGYIIDIINANLINYKLTENEVNAILKAFNNIDETDIKE